MIKKAELRFAEEVKPGDRLLIDNEIWTVDSAFPLLDKDTNGEQLYEFEIHNETASEDWVESAKTWMTVVLDE